MKTLTVKVVGDHLQTLSRAKKPILAVAELIWNALDADAQKVSITLEDNSLGALERIRVVDDGHGIKFDDAEVEFGSLGGSWKRRKLVSRKGRRLLHGRQGKGRFKAFSLGGLVTWQTTYVGNGATKRYTIVGRSDDLSHYALADPKDSDSDPGTEVVIENLKKNFPSLRGDSAAMEIASYVAPYLKQYPEVTIEYDGRLVTTSHFESASVDIDLEGLSRSDGSSIKAVLTVIEWKLPISRAIYLCDSAGFSLAEVNAGIQAPKFDFTAYLKSNFIRELAEEGVAEMEFHPPVKQLLDRARDELRKYFRKRASEEAHEVVRKWKEEKVYPYEEEPKTPVEEAERQVFDICALNVYSYLPDFDESSYRSRHLAFRLLRNALETNPSAMQTILTEVLGLPKKKQLEFAELLRQTSLDAIITASKTVGDRLNFLDGLGLLLFDPEAKEQLLERRQLHRLVAEHTWIFGEEFHLTVDDQSLTELLRKHRNELGDEAEIFDEVRREDGSTGVVDLVLGRRIPTPRGDEREHLVVELKRPKHKLNDKSLAQIKSYAFAVAEDERFRDTTTKWSFWLVSNDMTDGVRRQARLEGLPAGCVYSDPGLNMRIWVKSWSELLADCEGRLKFFQEQLGFRVNRDDSLAYLRREYNKYLPDAFQKPDEDARTSD